jgi:hypothetical protein
MLSEISNNCGPTPPSVVATRALAMAAVVCRGSIDHGRGNNDAEALHAELVEWVATSQLGNQISMDELGMIKAELGTLSEQQIISTTWAVEGLALLAWALKRAEFPAIGAKVNPFSVTDSVGLLSPDVQDLLDSASVQDSETLRACREFHYAVHSRVRTMLRESSVSPDSSFAKWIDPGWITTLGLSTSAVISDDELLVRGKPISVLKESELREANWILAERHRASIWLCNPQISYGSVTADT